VGNPLLDIIREGRKRKGCMTPYCTTCGSLECRNKLKELAGPLGGPLRNALEDIEISFKKISYFTGINDNGNKSSANNSTKTDRQ
jgi:hypothetical protein